jgi:hypothetical protein
MFGNRHRALLSSALMAGLFMAFALHAGERRLPEKNFRFGLDAEPGFKFVSGTSFQYDVGLVFKIRDRLSLIPRFGMHSYEYDKKLSGYTRKYSDEALNIGLTARFEFLSRITVENTKYEYDAESREFMHYYFSTPLRPYVQLHLGTFVGTGGGVMYYLVQNLGLGLGADLGYNFLADSNAGFGVIAPKAVIVYTFN